MSSFKRSLFSVLLFTLLSCNQTGTDSNLVEIEEILAKPTAYVEKTIIIQGVVNQVNSEKRLFSVISIKEFKECGIAECNAAEQLPIRFEGNFPEVGKQIEITGIVKQIKKGFIYEAQSIRNTENL